MTTPGLMVALAPIQQLSPMVMGAANSSPATRSAALRGWKAAVIPTCGAKEELSPITIRLQSKTVQPWFAQKHFPTVSCNHSQHERVIQSQRPRDLRLLLLEVSSQAPSVFLHPLDASGSAQNKLAWAEVFLAQVLDHLWIGEVRHPASFAFRSS